MAKKIYDIVPPHLKKKEKAVVRTIKAGGKKPRRTIKPERDNARIRWFGIAVSVVFVLAVICAYALTALPYLDVEIWPKTQVNPYTLKVVADKTVTAVDLANGKIPAQFISEDKELWQEFPATGSSSDAVKATGTITVYNKTNPATPVSLKAGTHFMSDSGKSFVSLSKISVPAATIKSGKVTPGSITVKVEAAEAGAGYNIDPSQFVVPKLAGTAVYFTIYASSTSPMTGGLESNKKVVSTNDISDAKNTLTQKLLDQALTALKQDVTDAGLVFLDNGTTKDILETSSSVKAGAEIDSFNYKVKVRVGALVFRASDLKSFADQYTLGQVGENQVVLDSQSTQDYTADKVDTTAGSISLTLKISSATYPKVDKQQMIKDFSGKTGDEITQIVQNDFNQQILQVRENFWPIWVKHGPKNQQRIIVNFNFQ